MIILGILSALIFGMISVVITGQLSGFFFGAILGYVFEEVIALRIRINKYERVEPKPVIPSTLPDVSKKPAINIDKTPEPGWVNQPVSESTLAVPTIISITLERIIKFFTTGNIVAKVGIITLFFGIAFLIKYAAQNDYFPVELRLFACTIAAIILFIIGWKIRFNKREYALTLQGGGVGLLYAVTFFAYKYYHFIPSTLTFAILIVLVIISTVLSVVQDARALAVMSVLGGFLAPLLAASDDGNYIALFSYYLILNLGICATVWFKAWRELTLLGFAFSFVIVSLWGYYSYQFNFYLPTQLFLIAFFLLYAAIPVVEAKQHSSSFKKLIDGPLVFGVPLLTYALQIGLTNNFEYGPAVSAFTLGLFYALLTVTIWQSPGRTFALLKDSYKALALLFATVSIPLAIADQWAGTVWALEGACVVWLSVRQNHFWGRIFAVLLQLGAGYLFISDFPILTASDTPFFNNVFLGCTTIALAAIFSSYHLRVNLKNPFLIETVMGIGMIIWGLLWWSIALSSQLINYLYPVAEISSYTQWILGSGHIAFYNGILLSFTFTSVIAWTLYQRFHWDDMRCIAIFLPLEIAFCVYISLLFAWGEYYLVPWIIAFSSAYWILWNHQKISSYYMPFLHGLTLIALIAEFSLQLNHYTTIYLPQAFTWTFLSLVALPIGYMLLLKNNYITNRWPIKTFPTAYFAGCGLILSIYLILWMLVYAPSATGDAPPLTYLPLLNPIDIAQALALLALYFWIKQPAVNDFFKLNQTSIKYAIAAIALLTFIWLNTLLMRALHHYAGIPYDWEIMFNSKLTQMTFSIAWIVLAFVITTYASKRHSRGLWYTGGALISVVVIKLFLIDLENTGTIERIIAFVIVGVLLLIIGYISPIPPRKMD